MVPDFDRIFNGISIVIVMGCGLLALLIRAHANAGLPDEIQNKRSDKLRWGCGMTIITFFTLLLVVWVLLYAGCGRR